MLLTALALLAVAILSWTAFVLFRCGHHLAATLVGATGLHEALLFAVPLIYSGLVDLRFERPMVIPVGEEELTRVALIEVAYVAIFVLTLIACVRSGRPGRRRPAFQNTHRASWVSWFLSALVLFGLLQLSRSLGQPVPTFEEVTHHADVVVRTGLLDNLLAWAAGAYLMPAFAAAGLLVSDPSASRSARLGAVLLLALLVAVGIGEGVRGRVVWAASFLALGALLKGRVRVVGFAAVMMALLVPISTFLAGPLRSVYLNELVGSSRWDILRFALKEGYQENADAHGEREPFGTNALRRAQGPRNSVVLLNLYDEGKAAGIRPLLGAVILPLPRMIWPEKPPAGSIGETNQGEAMYLVRRLGWDAPDYNMGPFLASAHAYWEAGVTGVILAAIGTALLWGLLLRFVRRLPGDAGAVLALTLLSALPIDGLFTMLVPGWVLVARFWSSLLLLGLLAMGLRAVWRMTNPERNKSAALLGSGRGPRPASTT